jgi:hypothetical protein
MNKTYIGRFFLVALIVGISVFATQRTIPFRRAHFQKVGNLA